MAEIHLQSLGEDILAKINSSRADGGSAYQLATKNGFVGTEQEWLHSLRGDDGEKGEVGAKGERGDGFDIEKVYGSLIETKADESNPMIADGSFVLINSEDADNGSLYVKKDGVYMFQAKLVGVRGDKGENGKRGRGVVVKGVKSTEGDLPLIGLEGDAYWVGDRLYIWSNDPLEVAEAGFLRGNSLKGNDGSPGQQGIQGLPGRNGSNANVTSASITSALGYTPTNQTSFNTHSSLNASKTVKGHMQVGDGLLVSNGVVSVDNSVNTSYGISTPISEFPLGVTEVVFLTNNTNQNYLELRSLVSSLMGYGITSGTPFRFYMKVTKRNSTALRQEILVTSNYTANIGLEYFRIHRETNYADGAWNPWTITVSTITGKESPEGVVTAFKGSLYFDSVNARLYKKTTSTTAGNSTGWDEVVTPKQFLSLGNGGVNISIGTAPFDIKLGTSYFSNKIPYNTSTGEFTLTEGKTYKIQFVANINTTGRVEIRAVTASGSNVTSIYGLWSGVSGDRSSNMYTTIIQPSSTTNYKLRVTVHSVASSTISNYTGHLEIIEL